MRLSASIFLLTATVLVCLSGSAFAQYIEWSSDPVDDALESNMTLSTLAIDAQQNPHIAYYDISSHSIRYATRLGENWIIETLEDGTGVDMVGIQICLPAIALDSDGNPHMAYPAWRDEEMHAIHAWRDSGSWQREVVCPDLTGIYNCRLIMDNEDNPLMTFSNWDGSNLWVQLCVKSDGDWSQQVIDEGDMPAFALDSQGNPHFLYRGWSGTTLETLCYASPSGETWVVDALVPMGSHPELTLDALDQPHITFKSGFSVYYGTRQEGEWSIELLEMGGHDIHRYTPIAIDWRGNPIVVFTDSYSVPRWAYFWEGTWHFDVIEGEESLFGRNAALAFDLSGHPYLSLYEFGSTTLSYVSGIDNDLPTHVSVTPGKTIVLGPNVPNPFNPFTKIHFRLPRQETVELQVYDLSGRLVSTLLNSESLPAGSHTADWHGRNDHGQSVASGMYIYRLSAGEFVDSGWMSLIR